MRTRKLVALLSTLLLLVALFPITAMVQAASPYAAFKSFEYDPGDTATLTLSDLGQDAAHFQWIIIPAKYVTYNESNGRYTRMSGFNWSASDLVKVTTNENGFEIPESAAGCFLTCIVQNASYSRITDTYYQAKISGAQPLGFNATTAEINKAITAQPDASLTPAAYEWYVYTPDMIADGKLVAGADVAAAKQSATGATFTPTVTMARGYIQCKTVDANGAVLQESAILPIALSTTIGAVPTMKKTVFGFEHVTAGAKLNETGPSGQRPSNNWTWNPNNAKWATLGAGANFTLTAEQNAAAPQGDQVAKWSCVTKNVYSTYADYPLYLEDPANTNVTGATEFVFWLDTTNYKNGSDSIKCKLQFSTKYNGTTYKYLSATTDANQKDTTKAASMFYLKDGVWTGAKFSYGFVNLPANYKGYVRFPLDGFVCTTAGAPNIMPLENVTNLLFYFSTLGDSTSYALLDDFAFAGDAMTRTDVAPAENLGGQIRGEDAQGNTALRFGFTLDTTGVAYVDPTHSNGNYKRYMDANSKVKVNGINYKVVDFGAILSADSTKALTIDDVTADNKVVKVPAINLYEVAGDKTSVTYTAVITNVPATKKDTQIYARSYVAYEDFAGQLHYAYGDKFSRSVNDCVTGDYTK